MTLADLKQGMICELRNGNSFTILNNNVNRNYYNDRLNTIYTLSHNYNDDLTHQAQRNYDIIKVSFGNETIYERQESNLFFEPNKNEYYYYICDDRVNGYINDMKYDDAIIKTNIVYKTEEEAVLELLRRQAKIRVIKEIARLNDGWDVREHWKNGEISKYYIAYFHLTSKLGSDYTYSYKVWDNNLYLKTRELAEQLIETHSDDLKLMLEVE